MGVDNKMELAMKKKSLEDSLSGHSAGIIDSERRIEVVGEDKFGKLLRKCGDYMNAPSGQILQLSEILTPDELNLFYKISIEAFLELGDLQTVRRKRFIDTLIKNSYWAVFNDFEFMHPLNSFEFISGIKCTEDNPLRIKMQGPSLSAGRKSSFVHCLSLHVPG